MTLILSGIESLHQTRHETGVGPVRGSHPLLGGAPQPFGEMVADIADIVQLEPGHDRVVEHVDDRAVGRQSRIAVLRRLSGVRFRCVRTPQARSTTKCGRTRRFGELGVMAVPRPRGDHYSQFADEGVVLRIVVVAREATPLAAPPDEIALALL
jgi:hypothetical protein